MRSMKRGACLLLLGVVLASLVVACGEPDETREITDSRTVGTVRRIPPMAPFNDEVRFGFTQRAPARPEIEAPRPARSYGWELPPGWSVGPARPMRLASFRVAERPEIDVSLTVLSGDGGGMVANVNRWQGQMGLPALAADRVAALPKIDVLGRKATLVEATGAFTAMDGTSTPGAALLGVIVELGNESLYVKMTGSVDAVPAERENFLRFCASLAVRR